MYDLVEEHLKNLDLALASNDVKSEKDLKTLTNLDMFEKLQNNMIIQYQNNSNYIIVIEKEKILGTELYRDLNMLLQEVYSINNSKVNEKLFDLKVEWNLNESIILIKEKLFQIAKKYVYKRINKVNSKDKNPIYKTIRLHIELLPALINMASIENSINAYMLSDMIIYISREFRNLISEESINKKSDIVKLLNINTDIKDDEVSIIKEEIHALSLKIKKMKPILQKHNLDTIEINKNDLCISWNWQYSNHNIGQITGVLDNQRITVNNSYNGLLVDRTNNQIHTSALYQKNSDIQMYKTNLYIIKEIYAHFNILCTNEEINQFENEILLKSVHQKAKSNNISNEKIINNKPTFRKLHVTTKKLKSFIESIGFIEVSRTGSHIKFRNSRLNKTCTFANKKDTNVYKIGSLKKILGDYNETLENLEIFLNN